jgi:hypothetical protein
MVAVEVSSLLPLSSTTTTNGQGEGFRQLRFAPAKPIKD